MSPNLIGITEPDPTIAEIDCAQSYEALMANTQKMADDLEVPKEWQAAVFYLLDGLKSFDTKTAKEALQSLPLSFIPLNTVIEFYNIEPERANLLRQYAWCATILHDIGKPLIENADEIIAESNRGLIWPNEYREAMKMHPLLGGAVAREFGLPEPVCRAIEESHGAQYGNECYGVSPELDFDARIVRDCLAIADFMDAALNRINTRTRGLTRSDKLQEVMNDVSYLFSPYNDGEALAVAIFDNMTRPQF